MTINQQKATDAINSTVIKVGKKTVTFKVVTNDNGGKYTDVLVNSAGMAAVGAFGVRACYILSYATRADILTTLKLHFYMDYKINLFGSKKNTATTEALIENLLKYHN